MEQPTNPEEIISQKRQYVKEYKDQMQNYANLWTLFKENAIIPEFQQSKRGIIYLLVIPPAVSLYFVFVNPASIYKNLIRISSIFGCFINLQMSLNNDFEQLVKKDTPIGNKARSYLQNISKYDPHIPYFEQETQEIIQQRVEKQEQDTIILKDLSQDKK